MVIARWMPMETTRGATRVRQSLPNIRQLCSAGRSAGKGSWRDRTETSGATQNKWEEREREGQGDMEERGRE
eukprot:627455-Rhodomonas_salina.1